MVPWELNDQGFCLTSILYCALWPLHIIHVFWINVMKNIWINHDLNCILQFANLHPSFKIEIPLHWYQPIIPHGLYVKHWLVFFLQQCYIFAYILVLESHYSPSTSIINTSLSICNYSQDSFKIVLLNCHTFKKSWWDTGRISQWISTDELSSIPRICMKNKKGKIQQVILQIL